MSVAEQKAYRLDGLKWLLVVLLLGGGVYGNFYYADQPVLYRAGALLVLVAMALLLAFQTASGAAFWRLAKGAQTEARRVVWPNRQERNQTTLVVVGFILVMGLILWGLDSLFGWLAALIIG